MNKLLFILVLFWGTSCFSIKKRNTSKVKQTSNIVQSKEIQPFRYVPPPREIIFTDSASGISIHRSRPIDYDSSHYEWINDSVRILGHFRGYGILDTIRR